MQSAASRLYQGTEGRELFGVTVIAFAKQYKDISNV